MACKACNSSRGDKGIYEWFELEGRNKEPRIVEGKYLKELYARARSEHAFRRLNETWKEHLKEKVK
jgi:hypothetical protein